MAKILVSYHPPFIDVIKELVAQGHEIVTTHPQFSKNLTDMDINSSPMSAHLTAQIQNDSQQAAAMILTKIKAPRNGLEPEAMEFMEKGLPGFLYTRLGDVAGFVMLLDHVKPNLILLHNDVEPLNRAAALWGKGKVPVLHVPHSVILDIEHGKPGDDIHDLLTASHIAYGGWYQKEWFEKRGAKNLIETGLPQFDRMAKLPLDAARGKAHLGLDKYKPVVTYASSWRQDTNLLGAHDGVHETYMAILETIKKLPQVQFVIKLHPRGNNADWHVEMAKQAGVEVSITAQYMESCLLASDLVLTYSGSNLLLEASYIPWLRMAATQGYDNDPEVSKVHGDPPDPNLLAKAIVTMLSKPALDKAKFQAKYLGATDGLAYKRVAEAVGSLL